MFYHVEKDEKKNCASIFNDITQCVSLIISFHLYFLRISEIWCMLHHALVGQVQSKECYFMFTYTFVTLSCCFSLKKCVFIIFTFFSDEVSSFRNKMLTNLEPELIIKNCQWNCMHNLKYNTHFDDYIHKTYETFTDDDILKNSPTQTYL